MKKLLVKCVSNEADFEGFKKDSNYQLVRETDDGSFIVIDNKGKTQTHGESMFQVLIPEGMYIPATCTADAVIEFGLDPAVTYLITNISGNSATFKTIDGNEQKLGVINFIIYFPALLELNSLTSASVMELEVATDQKETEAA